MLRYSDWRLKLTSGPAEVPKLTSRPRDGSASTTTETKSPPSGSKTTVG